MRESFRLIYGKAVELARSLMWGKAKHGRTYWWATQSEIAYITHTNQAVVALLHLLHHQHRHHHLNHHQQQQHQEQALLEPISHFRNRKNLVMVLEGQQQQEPFITNLISGFTTINLFPKGSCCSIRACVNVAEWLCFGWVFIPKKLWHDKKMLALSLGILMSHIVNYSQIWPCYRKCSSPKLLT